MRVKNNDVYLGLINYEGDVLGVVHKETFDTYEILNQNSKLLDSLNFKELQDFLSGERIIVDVDGREFHYPSIHSDAKPSMERLNRFIENTTRTSTYLYQFDFGFSMYVNGFVSPMFLTAKNEILALERFIKMSKETNLVEAPTNIKITEICDMKRINNG